MNSLTRKLKTLEQNVISDNPDPKETHDKRMKQNWPNVYK